MDQTPLVNEAKAAGREFLDRIGKIRRVVAACWLKAAERNSWRLYLALEGIDESNRRQFSLELLKLAAEMRNPYLGPLQFALIPVDHPLARDVMDLNRLYPGYQPGFDYQTSYLGEMAIDGIYIYPVTEPVPVQPS
jgi:hypothetical protein